MLRHRELVGPRAEKAAPQLPLTLRGTDFEPISNRKGEICKLFRCLQPLVLCKHVGEGGAEALAVPYLLASLLYHLCEGFSFSTAGMSCSVDCAICPLF